MSATASITETNGAVNQPRRGYARYQSYLEELANECDLEGESDSAVLHRAVCEVGSFALLDAIEIYRFRPKHGDLVWTDLWSAGEINLDAIRREQAVQPVVPGTGLVGTLWSATSSATKKKPKRNLNVSRRFGSSLGANTSYSHNDNLGAIPDMVEGQPVLQSRPSSLTASPDEEDTEQGKEFGDTTKATEPLNWRDMAAIGSDPDTWTCSRLASHEFEKAAGVAFNCDGVKGLVVYYRKCTKNHTSNQVLLMESLPMTAFLRRSATQIGSVLASLQARRACLAYRQALKLESGDAQPDMELLKSKIATQNGETGLKTSELVEKLNSRATAWYRKCWGAGLQIPPPMPVREVFWTLIGAFAGLLVLSSINELVVHLSDDEYSLVIGPFGAMMTLLYALPSAPASQPRNVILGEAIAGAVSMALSYLPIPKWLWDQPLALPP